MPNAGSGQPGSIATVIYRISLCTDHLACRVTAEDGLEMSWFPGPSWQHGRHSAERQRQLCDFSSKAFFLTDRITFGSLTAGRSKASLRSAVIRFTVAFLAKLRPQKLFEAAPASARSCFSAASSSCWSRDSRSCALLDATLRNSGSRFQQSCSQLSRSLPQLGRFLGLPRLASHRWIPCRARAQISSTPS